MKMCGDNDKVFNFSSSCFSSQHPIPPNVPSPVSGKWCGKCHYTLTIHLATLLTWAIQIEELKIG